MTYRVTFSPNNNFSVKASIDSSYRVNFSQAIEVMPQNLNELEDVEISGNRDKYVLMYDASTGKWRDVNPDEILNAAAETETIQPGLVGFATAFLNRLDTDLDDRIDIDAGTF